MKCFKCDGVFIQKYSKHLGNAVKRKRVCSKCGYELFTIEVSLDEYNSSVGLQNRFVECLNELTEKG